MGKKTGFIRVLTFFNKYKNNALFNIIKMIIVIYD